MHYYSFHVNDYLSHTSRLSMLEDLCYRRLLDLYYQSEQPISLDVEKVARLIGFRDHIQIVSEILSDFFLISDDGYRNKRCDEELAIYHAKADRARSANKKRWSSDLDLKSDMKSDMKSDVISDTKSDAKSERNLIPTKNHKPRTKNHKPNKEGIFTVAQMVQIPQELAAEFIWHRKAVKAPLSPIAWEQIVKEAEKAGWTVEDAVKECIGRGWKSFKADWVKAKPTHEYQPNVFSDRTLEGEFYETD